jgi:DNA polymerase-3 subunit delta'
MDSSESSVSGVPSEALATLSGRLCSWLREPLQRLETAAAGGRLGHAWLITGRPGLGKLNLALVFAERLLHGRVGAELPPDLPAATALEAMRNRPEAFDHHPDLHCAFPPEDKRSISIEQIRSVTDAIALKSFRGGSKVVVVEPAEAMTVPAQNALLKALEEPSPDTYMLLVSQRPGSLASTIRSRCQTLVVRAPQAKRVPQGAHAMADLPPLLATEAESGDYIHNINELYKYVNLVHESKRDPIDVADQWGGEDLEATLDWLGRRIHAVVRARVLGDPSKPVTDGANPVLHNVWPGLRLDALFEQFAAVEKLRAQLDTGINTELALRVLLMGFVAERG